MQSTYIIPYISAFLPYVCKLKQHNLQDRIGSPTKKVLILNDEGLLHQHLFFSVFLVLYIPSLEILVFSYVVMQDSFPCISCPVPPKQFQVMLVLVFSYVELFPSVFSSAVCLVTPVHFNCCFLCIIYLKLLPLFSLRMSVLCHQCNFNCCLLHNLCRIITSVLTSGVSLVCHQCNLSCCFLAAGV